MTGSIDSHSLREMNGPNFTQNVRYEDLAGCRSSVATKMKTESCWNHKQHYDAVDDIPTYEESSLMNPIQCTVDESAASGAQVTKPSLLERMHTSVTLYESPRKCIVPSLKKCRQITLEYHLHGNPNGNVRIVLIMGLLARKEAWGLTVEALLRESNDYHILTFDNRGVGNSDKPKGAYTMRHMAHDTIELMKYVGWTSAHIVGVSMGGMIALEIASRYPGFVQSLSLLVTTAGFPRLHLPGIMQLKGIAQASTSAFSRDDKIASSKLIRSLYSRSFLDKIVHETNGKTNADLYSAMHLGDAIAFKNSKSSGFNQFIGCMVHRLSHRRLHEIRDRNFPTLIVSATKDQVINPKCSLSLKKHLTHEKTRFVSMEAGHAVHLECIDEVVMELRSVMGEK